MVSLTLRPHQPQGKGIWYELGGNLCGSQSRCPRGGSNNALNDLNCHEKIASHSFGKAVMQQNVGVCMRHTDFGNTATVITVSIKRAPLKSLSKLLQSSYHLSAEEKRT
jgi:hypothetical protein